MILTEIPDRVGMCCRRPFLHIDAADCFLMGLFLPSDTFTQVLFTTIFTITVSSPVMSCALSLSLHSVLSSQWPRYLLERCHIELATLM